VKVKFWIKSNRGTNAEEIVYFANEFNYGDGDLEFEVEDWARDFTAYHQSNIEYGYEILDKDEEQFDFVFRFTGKCANEARECFSAWFLDCGGEQSLLESVDYYVGEKEFELSQEGYDKNNIIEYTAKEVDDEIEGSINI